MPDTLKLLVELWPLFAFLTSLVFGGTMLFLQSRFTSRKDCEGHRETFTELQEALEARQNAEATRQAALDYSLKSVPTAKDMEEMRLALKEVVGKIDTMKEQVKGQGDILQIVREQCSRMNNYLMEQRHRT